MILNPNVVVGEFPKCCIINNRKVDGTINIEAPNAIKLNDYSFVYILRDDNIPVENDIIYSGKLESNTLNDKNLLSEFNLIVSSEPKYE